jgi:hypothetical protein
MFVRGGAGQWPEMAQSVGGGGRMPSGSWLRWPRVLVPSMAAGYGSGMCQCGARGKEDDATVALGLPLVLGGFLGESLGNSDVVGVASPVGATHSPAFSSLGESVGDGYPPGSTGRIKDLTRGPWAQ